MKKTIMGILSIAPIVLLALTFLMMIGGMVMTETASEDTGIVIVILSTVVAFVSVILTWVDIIWFIIIACKKPGWNTENKVIWGLLLYFFNVFVFPVFWWKYIRNDD